MVARFLPNKPLRLPALLLIVAGLLMIPALGLAQDESFLTQGNANILWTLVAGILVMFMQAGFACVECGFTRAKNAGNIIMKNFLDFSAGGVAFFLFGFALMFGADAGGFIGTSGFGLPEASNWDLTFWFFQSVFAATAATIVSGAIAERTKFSGYIIISVIVTGVIYAISGHWCWGSLLLEDNSGWLEELSILGESGFYDFAGSTVVHSVGAWIGLAGAIVLGPRLGKYSADGSPKAIPGHNIPMAALGVFILWFGWFGFNPGSTTTADDTIGVIAVVTTLSAAAGTLGAMIIAWIKYGKPDPSMSMNGALAGLVAITAGCADVSPAGALAIGFTAGVLCVFSIVFLDKTLKVDDPVGAISVHGVCGAWGTLMVGFFHTTNGLFYGGSVGQLAIQAVGVGAVFVWAFGAGFIAFKLVDMIIGIRVSKEEELKGLDIAEHGSEAYTGFQIFTVD